MDVPIEDKPCKVGIVEDQLFDDASSSGIASNPCGQGGFEEIIFTPQHLREVEHLWKAAERYLLLPLADLQSDILCCS
ncbi:hypothetical protein IC63_06785 [Paracoccus sphaerophysae]|uniref:Uncharacterized protein n=1 Tax=Paracoccus sphaerophysae TaxID=690417 RepID=A0A099FCH7_9RHOB|nr:hypothetical protein IC63_06785 [Paracoccus sphaerophysae]